jgi:flagellar protein FliS
MNSANPWKSYRQIAAQTAPPGQLILMLFDGVLHSLDRALAGFEQAEPGPRNQTIHNNLRRAVDIIRQLNNSLNLEAGGELARTLRRLYHYFDSRLTESNLRKRREGIDEVIGHLAGIRNAWATMLEQRGQELNSPGAREQMLQPVPEPV